jgi:hypothetical protein
MRPVNKIRAKTTLTNHRQGGWEATYIHFYHTNHEQACLYIDSAYYRQRLLDAQILGRENQHLRATG